MKINIKNQNGAIALFVMLAMLFFLVFILAAYTMISGRIQTQTETETNLKSIYQTKNSDEIVANLYADSTEVIPIYNYEQFQQIATDSYVEVNGKIYQFTSSANYVLKSNIIVDYDSYFVQTSLDDVKLLDNMFTDYTIDRAEYDLYYYKSDGTEDGYFKVVLYQNLSDTSNSVFTSTNKTEIATKSVKGEYKYSILNELENYKYDGNYEFLLTYDNGTSGSYFSDYNWWYQTESPLTLASYTDTEGIGTERKNSSTTSSYDENWTNALYMPSDTDSPFFVGAKDSDFWYEVGVSNELGTTITSMNGFPTTTSTICYLFARVEL